MACTVLKAHSVRKAVHSAFVAPEMRAQVHPIAVTRLSIVLQQAIAAAAHERGAWLRAPFLLVGPPDASGHCMLVAAQGHKVRQKHPVTKEPLPCSFDGARNVHGGARGLFAAAAEESQVCIRYQMTLNKVLHRSLLCIAWLDVALFPLLCTLLSKKGQNIALQ